MKALKSTASPTIQAYGELQAAFEHYNAALFDGQLPHCLITMQREKRTYGYFSSRRFANRHEKTMTGLYAGIPEISVSPAPVPPRAHPGR